LREPDDETLVVGLLAGRQDAFKALAARHGRRGYALAYGILRNHSDADDVVQEALVKVWLNADQWQPDRGAFRTWFCSIVVNLCIDRGRRRSLGPTVELQPELAAPEDTADRAMAVEMEREIAVAIGQLPPRQRAALALCYSDDMSCAQGAKVLGVSVPAMESLLVRARRAVRRHLQEVGLLTHEDAR
jgi:RNA polymerase sigma-70 factor (ECF subfamily)